MSSIVMVHSYKGGVGKSWICLNIARFLEKQGKRILLIESDFTMPTYTKLFPELQIDLFFNDYLENNNQLLTECIYPDIVSNLGFIACNPEFLPSEHIFTNDQGWFFDLLERLNNDLNSLNYDFIIFDMSPGHSLFLVNILQLVTNIFIVSRLDTTSIYGTEHLLASIYQKFGIIKKINTHLVFNQIPKIQKFNDIIKTWQNSFTIKFPDLSSFSTIYLDEEVIYRTALNDYTMPEHTVANKSFVKLMEHI